MELDVDLVETKVLRAVIVKDDYVSNLMQKRYVRCCSSNF